MWPLQTPQKMNIFQENFDTILNQNSHEPTHFISQLPQFYIIQIYLLNAPKFVKLLPHYLHIPTFLMDDWR
jgi:hypothetical protein